MKTIDLEASLNKLYLLHTFGIKLGLENIQNFLSYIGDPQKKLKAFHIAGSNGKGSTAAFIASILNELDYQVGLYTSPHFVRFNERIQINGEEIPDEYIADFISRHERYVDEKKLTFFEVTTAMAFKYFFDEKVDYAVIETGLGGRLDATNVLSPLAVVITSISLEHTNILGDTIEQIAAEKAAIIKKNAKVFTGKLPEAADIIIEKKCIELGCELFRIEDYIIEKGNSLELYTEEIELNEWTMPLKGDYQKYNAALAGLAVTKILDVDDFNVISDGIKNVIKNTGIQGRYEIINIKPTIIFDSAHNLDSVEKFLSEFKKERKKYSKCVLLFGVMKDKAVKEMLQVLKTNFDEIHVTQIEMERSCTISELLNIALELNLNVKEELNAAEFVEEFNGRGKTECLVVLGSMYLLGTIKSLLGKKNFA